MQPPAPVISTILPGLAPLRGFTGSLRFSRMAAGQREEDAVVHSDRTSEERGSGAGIRQSDLSRVTAQRRTRGFCLRFCIRGRGVARLQLLITDGSGPCYVKLQPRALAAALQTAMQWLEAPD